MEITAQLTKDKITEIVLQTIFAKNFQKKSKSAKSTPMTVKGMEIAHLPCPMLKSLPL
jgi:hypothetical protein